MNDSWDDRRRAAEESYFEKQNRLAIERLKSRAPEQQVRKSPITGEPMEQLTVMGVLVDRCPTSGGIWLDAGELEQIIEAAKQSESQEGWLSGFLSSLRRG